MERGIAANQAKNTSHTCPTRKHYEIQRTQRPLYVTPYKDTPPRSRRCKESKNLKRHNGDQPPDTSKQNPTHLNTQSLPIANCDIVRERNAINFLLPYAILIRNKTHYAKISHYRNQNSLCSNLSLSDPYILITNIGKQGFLSAAPDDFTCETLIVPDGDCPGALRRTPPPPRWPTGVLGDDCESPRRPAGDGGSHPLIRNPPKKSPHAQNEP